MRITVKKWGNSASIRIPSVIMNAAQLRLDDQADIREEKGHILIEPVRPRAYCIQALVSAITSENRHSAADFGRPVGKEAF